MIERYSLPEMKSIWQEEFKFQTMLSIEILALEAYATKKIVPSGAVKRIKQKARFNLSESTRTAGAGVLAIRQDDEWSSDGPLWLVENQALFDRLDWLPPGVCGTVAYYGGQLPGRLLHWLAQRPRASEVVIFPDYDGVGLLNYAKLLDTCCSPCTLWLMPNWQLLLKTFGSAKVWQNTLSDFKTAHSLLMAARAPESVMELCAELRDRGLALEHEAVWLKIAQTPK